MHKLSLKKADSPTPVSLASGASASGLPPDLLAEASKRLGWAGLVYSGTYFFAAFGPQILGAHYTGYTIFDRPVQLTVTGVSILLGLGVFALSLHARIRPALLLDLGLIFEVVGAFGISMAQFWGAFPEWTVMADSEYVGIPWECVWIIIFPLLAPNTPGKILLASLAAASTGLLTILLSIAAGVTDPATPLAFLLVYFGFTTYLCAAIAFVISKIVYRFGRRLRRAREIGSYQLVRPLGQGGMGEVWLARHRMLARPAAIKLIRPEMLGVDDRTRHTVLARFEREALATATLDSYHTITLYDCGITEDGAFYYVMELLNGLNLEGLVKRFGPVGPGRTIHFLRQACHSLGEAHERGLIHRDVKPANIYTCRLGPEYDFVKVLDFGLVKGSDPDAMGATDLTREGVATGTPAFMAPEQALGRSDVDARADIYGLGCVGYWLLTGHRVFEGDGTLATVLAHVQEAPVPPSHRSEIPIPAALENVIMSCLEKDPAARLQSAADLDAALDVCPVDEPWTAERARGWWELHGPPPAFDSVETPPEEMSVPKVQPLER